MTRPRKPGCPQSEAIKSPSLCQDLRQLGEEMAGTSALPLEVLSRISVDFGDLGDVAVGSGITIRFFGAQGLRRPPPTYPFVGSL